MRRGSYFRGDRCLVEQVWHAANPWTRLRGLLGRPPLGQGEGLLIEPCASVHTFGMRYSIDLVFLDKDDHIVDMHEDVAPWRTRKARTRARKTLELPAGTLASLSPVLGERLTWQAR